MQCAHNVGFLLQDFCSLLDTLRGLALGNNQQVQPGTAAVACSEPRRGWRAPGRGRVGIRSWGSRGSCGSGLAARSCGGDGVGRVGPGLGAAPSAGGGTEVRVQAEPAAGLLSLGTGRAAALGEASAPLPAEFRERSGPGSGAGLGLGRAETRWECRDGEWDSCGDHGIASSLERASPASALRQPTARFWGWYKHFPPPVSHLCIHPQRPAPGTAGPAVRADTPALLLLLH